MKNVLAGLAILKQLHSEYKDECIDNNATYESLQDDDSTNEEDSQHNTAVAAQPEQNSDTNDNMDTEIDLEEVFNSQNEPHQSNAAAQIEQSEQSSEKEVLRPGAS